MDQIAEDELQAEQVVPVTGPPIRKVERAWLQLWLPTHIERLRALWPEANDKQIGWHLIGCTEESDVWFCECGGAIGLARASMVPIGRWQINEVFMLHEEGCANDAARLYVAMVAWAKNRGSKDLGVLRCSDFKPQQIRALFGKMHEERLPYVDTASP